MVKYIKYVQYNFMFYHIEDIDEESFVELPVEDQTATLAASLKNK